MKREAHESTNQLLFIKIKRKCSPALVHTPHFSCLARQQNSSSPCCWGQVACRPTDQRATALQQAGQHDSELEATSAPLFLPLSDFPSLLAPAPRQSFSLLTAHINPRQIVKPKPGRARLVSPQSSLSGRAPDIQRRQWQPKPAPSSSSLASWTKVRVFAPDHR